MSISKPVLAFFRLKRSGLPSQTIRLTTEWEYITFRQYRGLCLLPFREGTDTERQLMLLEILADYKVGYGDILNLSAADTKLFLTEASKSEIVKHPTLPDFTKDVRAMPNPLKTPEGPLPLPRNADVLAAAPVVLTLNMGNELVAYETGKISELELYGNLVAWWAQWKKTGKIDPATIETERLLVDQSPARQVIRAGFFFAKWLPTYIPAVATQA